MSSDERAEPNYDRQLLLLGPKRNAVLELWEVLRFGTDMFGDANYVSLYGLHPEEWYAREIRVLGRTAIECTPDRVADGIGRDIAETVAATGGTRRMVVIDPFAGSANTLYWILRHLPGAQGIGFELDSQVFHLTQKNLSILQVRIEFVHADYLQALRETKLPEDVLIVAFIAPPWGEAFNTSKGLDLRGTTPPVREIVDGLSQLFPNPMLFAIQVVQNIIPDSLTELTAHFDWSALHVYDSNKSGRNRNGLVLASRGRRPSG